MKWPSSLWAWFWRIKACSLFILMVWNQSSCLSFAGRNLTGSWSTFVWLNWCTADVSTGVDLISGCRIRFKGAFQGPKYSICFSLSTKGPRVVSMKDYIHVWSTTWQACSSTSATVVASLTHTCLHFTFHRFREKFKSWLGLVAEATAAGGFYGLWGCCKSLSSLHELRQWGRGRCGWQQRTSGFSLSHRYSTSSKQIYPKDWRSFNLLAQNERRTTVKNLCFQDTKHMALGALLGENLLKRCCHRILNGWKSTFTVFICYGAVQETCVTPGKTWQRVPPL